jgi:hypothetical protein
MKTQSQKILHLVLLVLLLLTAGCSSILTGRGTPPVPATETIPPAGITPSLENPPTVLPDQTEGLEPKACLPENDHLTLEAASYDGLPDVILNFLNAGGTIMQLDQDLYSQGYSGQPIGVIRGDINGDNTWDVAVNIINPYSPSIPPQAAVLVYSCYAGQYTVWPLPPPDDQVESSPIIRSFQDMNADGTAELVVSFASCGAHTCFETPAVYGWEDQAVVNLLADFGEPAPNPTIEINGPDANGYFVLLVKSGGIGSVGAGPQRGSQAVYAYQPTDHRWELFATQLDPPKYRLHALQDADNLARQEKYADALTLYQKVISSTTFQDWIDAEYEQKLLGAFARFRMITIDTVIGNEALAEATLDALQSEVQADDRLQGYLDMALLFRREGGAQDPVRACAAVRAFAERQAEQVLTPLGSQQFGYSNPDYTPDDMCFWN